MVRTTKVLVSVVSVAALVLGLFAQAIVALADTNNPALVHVHFFTENVEKKAGVPGDTFQFVVQYTNGGSLSFVKGAANAEIRLGTGWSFGDPANPLDNTNDFSGGWSSNWLSSNRLAAQTESTVLPGTNATFTWSGKIPLGAVAGPHLIKAQPVVDGRQWGENYGYYQGFDVAATGVGAAPTVASVTTPNGTARPQVCFSKPMAKSGGFAIDDTDHYSIAGFVINSIVANADGTCATLVLQTGLTKDNTFTLITTDVADVNGNVISPNPTNFAFSASDSVNPTVLSVSQPGTYAIVVKFSEAIDATTATAGAFRWDNGTIFDGTGGAPGAPGGSTAAVASATGITGNRNFRTGSLFNEQVRLDFKCTVDTLTGQPTGTPACGVSNGNHSLDVKDIKDAAGNVQTPNPTSFTVTIVGSNDTVRPTVTATVLQANTLNPACGGDGTLCKYQQYINVDYSESMQTGATTSGSIDFTPNTFSIDSFGVTTGNYTFQNPDGSPATTNCTSVGAAKIQVEGASMSRSVQSRFEQKRIRLRLQDTGPAPSAGLFQTGCNYTMTIGTGIGPGGTPQGNTVRDEAGNPLNPNPTVLTITATQDTTAPTVVRASSNGAKLLITYSKSMAGSASAVSKLNYTSTNNTLQAMITATVSPLPTPLTPAGNVNPYVNANGDETTVILVFNSTTTPGAISPLSAGTYPLTISGVTDPNGNVLTPNPTQVTFTVVDTTAPTILTTTAGAGLGAGPGATCTGSCFFVTFSKPMTAGLTGANSAGNPNNYAVNNGGYGALCLSGTVTIFASNNTQSFTIQCSGTGIWTTGNVVSVRNVADQAGNVINPNPSSHGF